MNKFENLNPVVKNKMLDIGRKQGDTEAKVKKEYEDAQRALHGSRGVHDNNILTRGFSCGTRGPK